MIIVAILSQNQIVCRVRASTISYNVKMTQKYPDREANVTRYAAALARYVTTYRPRDRDPPHRGI